jgi:hypothetical protein
LRISLNVTSLHLSDEECKRIPISINHFIATAVAEKMSALGAAEYLEQRTRRGSRRKFTRALAKVKDAEPAPADRI